MTSSTRSNPKNLVVTRVHHDWELDRDALIGWLEHLWPFGRVLVCNINVVPRFDRPAEDAFAAVYDVIHTTDCHVIAEHLEREGATGVGFKHVADGPVI